MVFSMETPTRVLSRAGGGTTFDGGGLHVILYAGKTLVIGYKLNILYSANIIGSVGSSAVALTHFCSVNKILKAKNCLSSA